jgi:hypothetical protein
MKKNLSFPRPLESKAYRRGKKSAINYVHLLIPSELTHHVYIDILSEGEIPKNL